MVLLLLRHNAPNRRAPVACRTFECPRLSTQDFLPTTSLPPHDSRTPGNGGVHAPRCRRQDRQCRRSRPKGFVTGPRRRRTAAWFAPPKSICRNLSICPSPALRPAHRRHEIVQKSPLSAGSNPGDQTDIHGVIPASSPYSPRQSLPCVDNPASPQKAARKPETDQIERNRPS